ncbi:hypothetical protein Tco_1192216 [Tanacetum coccineum]
MDDNEATNPNAVKPLSFSDDIDSAVSTPYASAPSSPGLHAGFFYSAPTSPSHRNSTLETAAGGSFEFELTTGQPVIGTMTSADELFLNGQIRPMRLSSHLQCPQDAMTLDDGEGRGRDFTARDRRRRARSMSPLRSTGAWIVESNEIDEINEGLKEEEEAHAPSSGASSRSSSVGRNSKRWVFLKELLLYRSKSEGRNRNPRFWSKKASESKTDEIEVPAVKMAPKKSKKASESKTDENEVPVAKSAPKKAVNGGSVNRKMKGRRSAHELHYTTNRAQAEEMRRKTFLPYRQGLLGCLGFSSKGYGAMNGFARALNPVSSR